jgi:hypothetical protein
MTDEERIAAIADVFRAANYPEADIQTIKAYLAGSGPLDAIPTPEMMAQRHHRVLRHVLFHSLVGLVCPDNIVLDTIDLRLLDICCRTDNEWAYIRAIAEQGPAEQVRDALIQRDRSEVQVIQWFISMSERVFALLGRQATAIDRMLLAQVYSDLDKTVDWGRRAPGEALWFAHLMLHADPPLFEKGWQVLQFSLDSPLNYYFVDAARLLLTTHPDVFFERLLPKLQERIAKPDYYFSDIFKLLVQQPWPERQPYIASLLAHQAQQVRAAAVNWLGEQGEAVIPDVAPLLAHDKPHTRLAAVQVLVQVGGTQAHALLTEHLANERTASVRQAILSNTGLLWATPDDQHNPQPFIDALSTEAAEQTKKPGKSPLPWFDLQQAPPLRWTTDDPVAPEIITYLFALQSQTTEIGPVQHLRQVAALLDQQAAGMWALVLWQGWLDSGAAAKTAWCLSLVGAFGNDRLVLPLHKQIDAWSKGARGAVAARTVDALALIGSDLALATVEDIASRSRKKQIADAARAALSNTARRLGITQEELADRIVPDLGFDSQGEQLLDYGPRQFTARVYADGTLRCIDAAGKVRTSPPKPGKSDDEAKAAAAQERWKLLKKQVKQVVQMQRQRLEQALIAQRAWDVADWRKLFRQHPLLRPLAVGLVWGVYLPDTAGYTLLFRPLDDGTLSDADDEPLTLPEQGQVRLVHPLELNEETRTAWVEHLSDYELVPPFAQLTRFVAQVSPAQHDNVWYDEYRGYVMNGAALKGRYQKAGWQRGSVQDGGSYSSIWKGFPGTGIEAILQIEGMAVGCEQVYTSAVGRLMFVCSDTVQRGSYVYDDPGEHDSRVLKLGVVPPIIFSEAVADVQHFAAAGQYDADWEKKVW